MLGSKVSRWLAQPTCCCNGAAAAGAAFTSPRRPKVTNAQLYYTTAAREPAPKLDSVGGLKEMRGSGVPVRLELLVTALCSCMAWSYSSGNPEGGGMWLLAAQRRSSCAVADDAPTASSAKPEQLSKWKQRSSMRLADFQRRIELQRAQTAAKLLQLWSRGRVWLQRLVRGGGWRSARDWLWWLLRWRS